MFGPVSRFVGQGIFDLYHLLGFIRPPFFYAMWLECLIDSVLVTEKLVFNIRRLSDPSYPP